MKIIKRNGAEVEYDGQRIMTAVKKANEEVDTEEKMSDLQIMVVEENVRKNLIKKHHIATVEEIQDMVIHEIMRQQAFRVAQLYTEYRYKQMLIRKKSNTDDAILSLIEYKNEEIKQENSNKNPMILSTQRDYIAGEISKDLTWRILLPQDIVKAHEEGIIHFHDSDYFIEHMHNCCLINMEDMLQNGTVITETQIESPNSIRTACNIGTQIIAQVASSQFGGQTFSLSHLVPFVEKSRQKQRKKMKEHFDKAGIKYTNEQIHDIVEELIKDEIKDGIQTIQYQLLTLMTTNGQTPFVSMYININDVPEGPMRDDFILMITEVFRQRIQGIKNEKGIWVTATFPKILYVLDENNVYPDSKYIDLTILAAKCTAARMVPDYISAKIMREYTDGDVYGCMGCRSFLTKDRYSKVVGNISNANNFDKYESHYWGRFNQGVVTINLVDIALSSHKDMDEFWKIFDKRLELCHRALRCRHERLLGTPADVAPILWRHGALARLEKGEVIDKLLYNGYSTLSLGYAGLYEMCYYMTGKSHTDPEGEKFATEVMQHMNDMTAKWKTMENIDYSLYGTPLESSTYRFAKCLQNRFGKIEGVTDHNYITNSYHVNVREKIDAFTKLAFESKFQKLSPGGAISYVETPDMKGNIPALLAMIRFIYNNIKYAEFNSKSDYCWKCGYDGEIKIVEDEHGKLIWECPNCGNRNQAKMNVARRTCGYIGSQFWNQGRTQEIKDRVLHVGIETFDQKEIAAYTNAIHTSKDQ